MNIELFVHYDEKRGARATVKAWWHDGTGLHHAELVHSEALDVQGDPTNPWGLLAGLYLKLAEIKNLPPSPPAER